MQEVQYVHMSIVMAYLYFNINMSLVYHTINITPVDKNCMKVSLTVFVQLENFSNLLFFTIQEEVHAIQNTKKIIAKKRLVKKT